MNPPLKNSNRREAGPKAHRLRLQGGTSGSHEEETKGKTATIKLWVCTLLAIVLVLGHCRGSGDVCRAGAGASSKAGGRAACRPRLAAAAGAAGSKLQGTSDPSIFNLCGSPTRLRGGSFKAMPSETSFNETFSFLGTELHIRQDTSLGHDAVLWDAGEMSFDVLILHVRCGKMLTWACSVLIIPFPLYPLPLPLSFPTLFPSLSSPSPSSLQPEFWQCTLRWCRSSGRARKFW